MGLAEPGRPSSLTPSVCKKIIEAIRKGATYTDAAWAGGITYQTFRNWMTAGESEANAAETEGREPEGKYFDFFYSVKDAEAAVRVELAGYFRAAARDDWRAAADFLRRRDPDNWGDRQKIDHAGGITYIVPAEVLPGSKED